MENKVEQLTGQHQPHGCIGKVLETGVPFSVPTKVRHLYKKDLKRKPTLENPSHVAYAL